MPITAQQTTEGEEKTAHLEWAGDTVTFTYNPNRITGELVQHFAELDDFGKAAQLAPQVSMTVTSWDVLERAPEPGENLEDVPRVDLSDVAALNKLGSAFLGALVSAMEAEQRPPGGGSFGGG